MYSINFQIKYKSLIAIGLALLLLFSIGASTVLNQPIVEEENAQTQFGLNEKIAAFIWDSSFIIANKKLPKVAIENNFKKYVEYTLSIIREISLPPPDLN